MININPKGKVKLHWRVSPYDYSKDKERQLIAKASKKYDIPKASIVVFPEVIVKDGAKEIALTDSVVDNIQDPQFQIKLFKEYLKVNEIENYDFDFIKKIDKEINGKIDYQVYNKLKRYSIKWIKWSNFRSYGPDNYFDFTNLHNLVLLNGEPANQSGKTTFAVDLLHFLLFGNMKKVKTQDEIFNSFLPQATEMSVEGCINIDGEDYIIKRVLTRPQLSKRTAKSHTSQKVEYYHMIGDEIEELSDYAEAEHGENTQKTNKIIKESIGREDDFDLIMCITGSNLDDLIEEKPTERGRIFSRWIGLLPLETKDLLAREKFNSIIKPSLLSNQYNKETLNQEILAYEVEIKNNDERTKEIQKANENLDKEIKLLEANKKVLASRKASIDANVLKIDITTLRNNIEAKKNEGVIKKSQLDEVVKKIKEIGEVDFSVEEYEKINNQKTKALVDQSEKRVEAKNLQALIKQLKTSEYCPTCGRKLDNVDNSVKISEQQQILDRLIIEGKKTTENVNSLTAQLDAMKANREKYNELNSLNAQKPIIELNLERLRGEYKDLIATEKEYNKNSEAIDKNNEIDIAIMNNDGVINAKRTNKESNIREFTQLTSYNENYNKEITKRKELISKLSEEEKVLYNWKLYLEMVGKNGISKMVMRKALPIINARLAQLLDDVCDFSISIDINNRNEVEFNIIKRGVTSSLYSGGSGFEKTAAALALRCVLAEVSTISKANFIIIDEILGRTAKENYENMKNLYDKIAKNYDFMFHITHIEEVKEWHDDIVTVTKDGNDISSLKQVTNTRK